MVNRGDLDKLTNLSFSDMVKDLKSERPAITKASFDYLSEVAFREDLYFPDTKLPSYVEYNLPVHLISHEDLFLDLSQVNYFFGLDTKFKSNGLGDTDFIIYGHLYNNSLKDSVEFHIQNCFQSSPGGKEKYFKAEGKKSNCLSDRKEVIYFKNSISNPLTSTFIEKLICYGLRFNESMGVVYGLEESEDLRGLEFTIFREDILGNKALQAVYGFELGAPSEIPL